MSIRSCWFVFALLLLSLAPAAAQTAESHLVPHSAKELGFTDYQGVLHSHSYLSHDSKISQQDIIAACAQAKIEFLCMTDHPSPRSLLDGLEGMHGSTFFLVGAEVNHFLAIDIHTPIGNGNAQETVDRTHAQGGLAFVAHSEEFTDWDTRGYEGMEIYNIHTDLKDEQDPKNLQKLIAKLPKLLQDPEWGISLIFDEPKGLVAQWDKLTQTRRVVGVAGNDAHQNVNLMGVQLDPYARSVGFVNTHIFALGLTKESILDALKSGHVYVCFERFAPGKGFSFTGESGQNVALMGDEIAWSEDLVLRAVFPQEARITFVKNGEAVEKAQAEEATFRVPGPGVYRVEAKVKARGKYWPWIYGNPIYVR